MFDWLKGKAALLAELREAREMCAAYNAELASVSVARTTALNALGTARESLNTVTGQRDAAWARIKELRYEREVLVGAGPLDSPTAPRTATAELLQERARADQLAKLVERLQAANMAAGCRHGIPLVEMSSRL